MRFFDRFLTAQLLDPDPAGPAQPDQPARPAQPPPAPAPLLYVVPEPRPFEVGAELRAEVPPGVLAAALEGIPVFPIPPAQAALISSGRSGRPPQKSRRF